LLIHDKQHGLAAFPFRDQRRYDDYRQSDNHPVLKRDAKQRESISQPVVRHPIRPRPEKLLKSYFWS
jgi:hypothetical protein